MKPLIQWSFQFMNAANQVFKSVTQDLAGSLTAFGWIKLGIYTDNISLDQVLSREK